ncbi:MAG: hypothetical protein Q8R92_20445, partial [Deltaproteobacteria bacterium]|nr:hypothetical protein [Deltaproteobacteria bacterium]
MRGEGRRAGWLCVALLILFAAVAWLAVSGKSAVYDETLHTASAWAGRYLHDYRIDAENPPLWKYWVSLLHRPGDLRPDGAAPEWNKVPEAVKYEWSWTKKVLFNTPGVDGHGLIARSRVMMLGFALLLGALIAIWSWRLGGAVAAVAATTLYSLDPNFIGHGPLVKNDVAATLVTLAGAYTAWQAGRRLTWARMGALALVCGIAVNVKFSALLLGPVVVLLLLLRALLPEAWEAFGRARHGVPAKLLLAATACVLCALVSYATIWAAYGFRFGVAPDPAVRMETERYVARGRYFDIYARHPDRKPSRAEAEAWRPGALVRGLRLVEEHRLLPQPYVAGLLYTWSATRMGASFLQGRYSMNGWVSYYPRAMLFKTPVATLLAMLCALAVLAGPGRRVLRDMPPGARWAAACLALPVLLYGATAAGMRVNYGVRHIFPIYPFLFIATGLAVKALWADRRARIGAGLLAGLLALETFAAFPDYIAFFNAPSGGARGGL